MKNILFISLFLLLTSCDLFKKVVKKEVEIKDEKTEQVEDKKSELSQKTEQETLVLETENHSETTKITADSISYNPHSGEFRASGNVAIISTKKADKQSEKQQAISEELRIKKEELKQDKQENHSEVATVHSQKTKISFGFWKWILVLILVIIIWFVYRRLRKASPTSPKEGLLKFET